MTTNGKLMEAVRAIVRPAITLSGWAAIIYLVLTGAVIPEWFQTTVVGLTTWWFATRISESKTP